MSTENLNQFFEEIKTIGFFRRIFSWKYIKKLSYSAYEEYKSLAEKSLSSTTEISEFKNEIKFKDEKIKNLDEKNTELEKDKSNLNKDFSLKDTENNRLNVLVSRYEQTEETRKGEYDRTITNLNTLREKLENDEKQRLEEVMKLKIDESNRLKQGWANHESDVELKIKSICSKHTIEYLGKEQVPFKGKPDNTIKICDEFIIFDAKNPGADDLKSFPNYIKTQTDSVKKYVNEENVKRDIFLVVPSNSLDVIKQFVYNMGDYNAYIITVDSLEPIILSLKKIEEYEFADKLSPEDRDNICRVIGKFAHTTKRKLQIDYFFSNEFLSILSKCRADLPKDILEKVIDFEMAEKLNPPMEKRSKHILTADLVTDNEKLQKEVEAKGIVVTNELQAIKNLPLYVEEKKDDITS